MSIGWVHRVCCILILMGGMASGGTVQAQQYLYRLDFTVGQRNFVDTVPIEYEREQVYVPVMVEGKRLRFKLDTGSSQGVVYDDTPIVAKRLKGRIRSEDAVGRSGRVEVVELPELRIGHVALNGYKAAVHHRQVARAGEDGIIGFDLFRRFAAKIDVRRRYMVLTDLRTVMKGEQGYPLAYKLENHTPRVKVSPLAGRTTDVVFDTGSRQLLSLNSRWTAACVAGDAGAGQQVEGRGLGQMAIGNYGVEQESEVFFLALRSVGWGRLQLRDIHCVTTQGNSHIGAPLLSHGTLVVNPFQKRLVFRPYDEQVDEQGGRQRDAYCVVGNPQLRIAIVPKDGKAAVGLIWEQSEAYRQGFRQGDVIERINGQPLSFSDFISYRAVFNLIYTFTLRDRQGVLRTVQAEMPTLERTKH